VRRNAHFFWPQARRLRRGEERASKSRAPLPSDRQPPRRSGEGKKEKEESRQVLKETVRRLVLVKKEGRIASEVLDILLSY